MRMRVLLDQGVAHLSREFKIPKSRWIYEDVKDLHFEKVSPFLALDVASGVDPIETGELIHVLQRDGTAKKLVSMDSTLVHHLSRMKLKMARLYLVNDEDGPEDPAVREAADAFFAAE